MRSSVSELSMLIWQALANDEEDTFFLLPRLGVVGVWSAFASPSPHLLADRLEWLLLVTGARRCSGRPLLLLLSVRAFFKLLEAAVVVDLFLSLPPPNNPPILELTDEPRFLVLPLVPSRLDDFLLKRERRALGSFSMVADWMPYSPTRRRCCYNE